MKSSLLSLRIAVAFGLLAGSWQESPAAMKISMKDAVVVPFSICPEADGANVLNPNPPTYLPPPGFLSPIRLELAIGDTDFGGWTFKKGAALNGTLKVKKYISKFVGDHFSGGEIEAQYEPAATDPAGLHFMQLVSTSDPLNGGTSPYMDPFPNDDDLPFYWTTAEEADADQGKDLRFYDFSKRSHPPNSFVTWRGSLYLSSWDGANPGTVSIHDGVRWGWDAGCVEGLFIIQIQILNTTTIVLIWTDTALPHRVEWTETLGTNAHWQPLTGIITETNGQKRMEVPRDKDQCYYRITLVTPEPEPPSIVTQPASQTNVYGATVTLEVEATGAADLAYQWMRNGVALDGETNSVLTLSNAQPHHAGQYHAVIANEAGMVTSASAMMMLRNCALNISSQPRNTTNAVGTTATFSVAAGGFPAPSTFQWQQRSGTLAFANIPGATSQTYARQVTMQDNNTQFRCIVGNGCATVPSAPATLTVNGGPPNGFSLLSASAFCNEPLVFLTFSQPVDPVSAMNPFAYQLMPLSGPPLQILDVQMESPTTIWLILDAPILPESQYVLTAQGVRDLAGNSPPPGNTQPVSCH